MSESSSGIVVPFATKKLSAVTENSLQEKLFMELESKGYLRVKAIGATCSVHYNGQVIARVCYIEQKDAKAIGEAMNLYFKINKMGNFAATVETLELF